MGERVVVARGHVKGIWIVPCGQEIDWDYIRDAEANTNTVPNVRQAQLPRAHESTTASKGGQDDTRHGNPRALSVRALAQDKQDGAQ